MGRIKKALGASGILFLFAGLIGMAGFSGGGILNAAHADSTPFVTLDTWSGIPGSAVQVTGGNFAVGETVDIMVGASATAAATTTAGNDSLFGPVTVTIPASATQGNIVVRAVGASSTLNATNNYFVEPLSPLIAATSTADTPGSVIMINGSGFAAHEQVAIAIGNASTTGTATATADASGTFSGASLVIPFGLTGEQTITATGTSSHASGVTYFYVNSFYPSVTPSLYYVLPGNPVTFSGSGFAGNETVDVTASGATGTLATFAVDASGAFSKLGSFIVPPSFAGSSTTVTLRGETSGATAQTEFTVGTYYPSLTPSLYYLERGNSFTVGLNGFAPYETVDVDAYGNPTVKVTMDGGGNNGSVGSFTVPFSASDTLALAATGETSGAVATGSISIGTAVARQLSSSTLAVSLSVDNAVGGAATSSDFTVNVSGADADPSSFAASSTPVTVTLLGDTDFTVTATSSDPNYAVTTSGVCDGQIASSMSGTCSLLATYVAPTAPTSTPTSTASSTPSSGNTSGSSGGGLVVIVPAGIGNNTPATSAPTGITGAESTGSNGGGLVLGVSTGTVSTVDVAALQSQLLALEQQLTTLEFRAAGVQTVFSRNLTIGMTGNDVLALQKLLNTNGLTQVAANGAGSPGHETDYYGPATAHAVAIFQNLFATTILVPNGLPAGNGFTGPSTRAVLNELTSGGTLSLK